MAETINPLELVTSSILSIVDPLLANVINQIRTMRDQGIASDTIRESIFSSFSEGRGGLESITSTVRHLTNSLQARYYRDTQNARINDKDIDPDTALYMWNATGSNTCAGCIARHGQVKTYSQWARIGLPGAGTTPCEENCRCTLLNLKQAQRLYGVANPAELTKAARQPIKDRLAEIKKLVTLRGAEFSQSTTLQKLGQFRKTDAALSKSARVSPESANRVQRLQVLVDEFERTGSLKSTDSLPQSQRNALKSSVKILIERRNQKEKELALARSKK